MGIEERELHYAPDSPLRAWRLFRVRASGAGLVLSSPMYHDPGPPPWPAVGSVATCSEGHPAPAAGCRCGIYAAVPGTLDSLPGYLLDTAHDGDMWAYAEIACSGRVFVDMRGVRAERAEIVRIALPDALWPDEVALDAAKRMLRERYGVPVGGLDSVPEWVTGNQRDAGRPLDETSLDLDLRRLDLG
ncbi:hypothetical protein [Phytohabitans houttuyneae]|uniref:Uncharacterized protein n=1 Tax=Phytohabitans houttuyneae TaxID=1076126 RepID=A0A6V8KRU2_9ACTN|nr:hypothetical protein [Phytohabitans houttuyneae]GFJ83335.1 hypothetical protein Phou_075150 [Phytohabitans houttuyneae]